MLRGKFIAVNIYIYEEEKSQFNNLTLHLEVLDKKIIKTHMEINKKRIKKIETTQKLVLWSTKLTNLLAKIAMKKEKTQIIKSEMKVGRLLPVTEISKYIYIWEYCEQL